MLKKRYKLPVQECVRRDGRTTRAVHFSLRTFPAASSNGRVGVVVSLRTAKKAVERNRMKRLVFDFFRLHRSKLLSGDDVLVTVRPSATALSRSQFVRELAAAAGIPPTAAPRNR